MASEHQLTPRDIVQYIEKGKTEYTVPLGTQAELLGISRSSLYYQPEPVDEKTLFIMHKIDEVYTEHPFYGSRKIAKEITEQVDEAVNRKRIQRLMRQMGIEAIYQKPNLSMPHPERSVYPYLLRGIVASHPNHIWGTDITYIRMKQGFLYLSAYIDWFSRFVLSWRLSTTLEIAFVLEAAEEALTQYHAPEIENSDQGSHYTSEQHIQLFTRKGSLVSMDGRGRAMDNIFTERLWRTIKYEEVYLNEYATVLEAQERISAYMHFYNYERKHQSLNYKTPAEIYFGKEDFLSLKNSRLLY